MAANKKTTPDEEPDPMPPPTTGNCFTCAEPPPPTIDPAPGPFPNVPRFMEIQLPGNVPCQCTAPPLGGRYSARALLITFPIVLTKVATNDCTWQNLAIGTATYGQHAVTPCQGEPFEITTYTLPATLQHNITQWSLFVGDNGHIFTGIAPASPTNCWLIPPMINQNACIEQGSGYYASGGTAIITPRG